MRICCWGLSFALAAALGQVSASEPGTAPSALAADTTPSTQPVIDPSPSAPDMPGDCCTLAAGTPVDLELAVPVTSWERKRGDRFELRLVTPIRLDGIELIPAGTVASGEVVHAAAARGGGAPGELILAARTLDHACGPIPLRGFRLGGAGGDNSGMAIGVSTAIGPFAMFIRGHELEIPARTRATAKLAEPLHAAVDGRCRTDSTMSAESPAVDHSQE